MSGLGIWPLDNGVELEAGALGVAVLGAEELGAGLLYSSLLCLVPSGAECVVFADAIFSELAPEVVEDFFSGLDLFLLWIRGAASIASSSELGEELGLDHALLAGLLERIFTETFFVLLAHSLIIGLLFSALELSSLK